MLALERSPVHTSVFLHTCPRCLSACGISASIAVLYYWDNNTITLKYKIKDYSSGSVQNKIMPFPSLSRHLVTPLFSSSPLFFTAILGHLPRFADLSLSTRLNSESSGILPAYSNRGDELPCHRVRSDKEVGVSAGD